jgi:hypothetical protein
MSLRQHVISVSYDAGVGQSFDRALQNAGVHISQLHSLQTAFIAIGHQKYAAVVFHACVPQEDVAVLSMLARWRSPRSRVVALHGVPFDASLADLDLYAFDDPTTIARYICDLIEARPGKISAMGRN